MQQQKKGLCHISILNAIIFGIKTLDNIEIAVAITVLFLYTGSTYMYIHNSFCNTYIYLQK